MHAVYITSDIDTLLYQGRNPDTYLYLSGLYHGICESPKSMWRRLRDPIDSIECLILSRTRDIMPEICYPRSWVVSHRVYSLLRETPHVQFKPVIFNKLVNHPFPPNLADIKYAPSMDQAESRILDKPDDVEFHRSIDEYYEMFAPVADDFISDLNILDEEQYAIIAANMTIFAQYIMDRLTKDVMQKHPILISNGLFVTDAIYNMIQGYLHPFFFETIPFELK